MLFLGSSFGDSIGIQFSEDPIIQSRIPSILDFSNPNNDPPTNRVFFKEIFKIVNTGPILDFVLSSMDAKGSSTSTNKQIVACCGAFSDSRLKVIKNDLSVQVALAALFGNWSSVLFERIWNFPRHSLCILSTCFQTVFLSQVKNSFKDVSFLFSKIDSPSILVSPLDGINSNVYIRVIPSCVIVFQLNMNMDKLDVDVLACNPLSLSYNPLVEVSFCSLFYDMLVCVFIDSFKGQSIISFYKISSEYSFVNVQETIVCGQISAFSMLPVGNLMCPSSPYSGILAYATWEFPSDVILAIIHDRTSISITETGRYTLSNANNDVIKKSMPFTKAQAYEMPLVISSLQLASFVNVPSENPYAIFLAIGTGDGQLFILSISLILSLTAQEVSLLFEKKIGLGNTPVRFSSVATVSNTSTAFLFAWGDFSVILFFSSPVLRHVFLSSVSNSNVSEFTNISLFSNTSVDSFRSSIISIGRPDRESDPILLTFNLEEIITQHMQITSFPLIADKNWEMPIRICHCDVSNVYAVITLAFEGRSLNISKNCNSYLRFFDSSSMRAIGSFCFPKGVQATCLDIINSLLIVGCSVTPKDINLASKNEDPSSFLEGSLFVFNMHSRAGLSSPSPLFEHKIPNNSKGDGGPLYSLTHHRDFILAGIQAQILVFGFDHCESPQKLIPAGQKYAQILPMYLTIRDDELIMGDIMKSISVSRIFVCNGDKSKFGEGEFLSFEELGKEYSTRWMTSEAVFSTAHSKTYVGCDGEGHLFFLQRPTEKSNIVTEKTLKEIGSFYIGDTVNKFQQGTVSLQQNLDKEADLGL